MNTLLHWLTAPEWSQVVKTLLHSLWQGALIATALVLIMRRLANPYARYRCSLVALAAIPVAGIITWAILNSTIHQPPAPLPIATEAATPPNLIPLNQSPVTKLIVFADHTPAPPQSRWTAWLALAWLVGAIAMLGRAGAKVAGAERLRRACQPLDHPQIAQLVTEARRAVGLARKIRVAVTDKLTSPAVVGMLLPTLILPLSLVTTLTPEQIRFILLHELAHIRRGDYFANLFQLFVEALLFFNPAVWWISHQVRREREACCDALAIELSGAPADYARTLVHVAENVLSPTPAGATAFGGDREPSSLADRIQRLLVPGYRPSLRLTWRAMIGAFVLGAVMLVLSAEGTRVAVAELTKPPTQATYQKETSSQESEPKLETESHSSENLNDFEPTSWPLDSNRATLSGPENLGGMTDWDVNVGNTLPLPALRLNRVTNVALSDKIPFLGDLPWVGKLFTSSQAKSGKADFVQLSQLSTLNEEVRSRHNITDSLSIRFQDTVAGSDLVLAQLDRQSDRLASNDNARTEFTLGGIPQLGGNSALMIDPYDQVGTDSWKAGSQNQTNQQRILFTYGGPRTEQTNLSIPQTNSPLVEVSGLSNSSRVEYDIATGKTVVTNGGVVRSGDTTIRADSIQLNHSTGRLVASGNVRLETPDGVAESTNANWNVITNALQTDARTNLSIRIFKVSPNTFWKELENVTSTPVTRTNVRTAVLNFFATLGLELKPPKSIFYNDRAGELLVRSTSEDLDVIEAVLQVLNKDTPQVNIKVRFIEIDLANAKSANDLFLGSIPSDQTLPGQATQTSSSKVTSPTNAVGNSALQFTGILTDPQYRVVLRALERQKGVEVLAMGEVTTLSGRQAQIQTVELKTVVNGVDLPVAPLPGNTSTNSTTNSLYQTKVLPFGPVLDVIPTVSLDGHTIQMTVSPTVTEFLGYDAPDKALPKLPAAANDVFVLPLPRMRLRQVTTSAVVWDGQTLVLGIANDQIITKQTDGGFLKEKNPDAKKRQLFVFITTTIVDPAGNRSNVNSAPSPAPSRPQRW